MTPNQTNDVIAGYRKATDAQQQIIDELREQNALLRENGHHLNLCRKIAKCPDDETLAEWLKGFVHLYDPVVTEIVECLKEAAEDMGFRSMGKRYVDALSAYEARVKSIEPALQNHGHMNIDYKYNNETTTMSPARVKEVEK